MEEPNLGIEVGEIIDGRISRESTLAKSISFLKMKRMAGLIAFRSIPFYNYDNCAKDTKKGLARNPTKNNKHSFH